MSGTPDQSVTLEDNERTPCEIYTRVMGYHRPVTFMNIGKRSEFEERKFFKELPGNERHHLSAEN